MEGTTESNWNLFDNSSLVNFSSHGMIVQTNLNQLGLGDNASLTVRFNNQSRSVQHILAFLPEPESKKTVEAVRRYHVELRDLGFNSAWYGAGSIGHPVTNTFANVGFEHNSIWIRLEASLSARGDLMVNDDVSFEPWSLSPEEAARLFDENRSGPDYLDLNKGRDLVFGLILHEIHTEFRSFYFDVRQKGETVGFAAKSVFPKMKAAIFSPYLSRRAWGSGAASDIVKALMYEAKSQGAEKISTNVAESQGDRLGFYKELGFVETGKYEHYFMDLSTL